MAATALGPVLGGLLASQNLWRGIFFVNLPAAVAAVIAAQHIPPDPPRSGRCPDALSTLLLAAGLGALSAALIEQIPWLILLTIVLLALLSPLAGRPDSGCWLPASASGLPHDPVPPESEIISMRWNAFATILT